MTFLNHFGSYCDVIQRPVTVTELQRFICEQSRYLTADDFSKAAISLSQRMGALRPGSLVIVTIQRDDEMSSSLRFARCICVKDTSAIVTFDPWERPEEIMEISCTDILVSRCPEIVTSKLLEETEKNGCLIHDPFEDVVTNLVSLAREKLRVFFEANGVDPVSLQNALQISRSIRHGDGSDACSLSHISLAPAFGVCSNTISNLRRQTVAQQEAGKRTILEEIEEDACDAIVRWITEPTSTRTLVTKPFAERVSSFISSLPQWSLDQLNLMRSSLYDVLNLLERRLEMILSGRLKDEMVEGWLRRVELRVDEFLDSFGYDVTALSSQTDIFNERPKNMLQIRKNLALMTELLNPSSQYADRVIAFIVDVTREVYVKIDELERQILQVIALTTGIEDASSLDAETPLDSLKITSNFGLNARHVRSLLADLQYLRAQRRMDNAWLTKATSGQSVVEESLVFSHVLPISSHVNDQFRTRLNDLTNAVERWPREVEAKSREDEGLMGLEDGGCGEVRVSAGTLTDGEDRVLLGHLKGIHTHTNCTQTLPKSELPTENKFNVGKFPP